MKHAPIDLDTLSGWTALLDDAERSIRDSVRRFVKSRCMPRIVVDFEKQTFARELVPELAGLGLLGANLVGYGCYPRRALDIDPRR